MADDFDVEAMLEAPYRSTSIAKDDTSGSGGAAEDKEDGRKGEKNGRSRSRSPGRRRRSRSRDRERRRRTRSRSRDRGRSKRSRSRDRRRSPERRKRSRSRERRRSKSRDRSTKEDKIRRRSKSRERHRRSRSRDKERRKSASPKKDDDVEPTPETRDSRTVFVMQLSQRVRARDLENFFSSVGKVRDVKIISDRNSRRSKGVGYVEFQVDTSVPLALGLTNQKLMGIPIIVQPSQAEKNRAAQTNQTLQKGSTGPMRLYVGSLHYNITEEMLRGIFEPFGKIDNIQLMMDSETQRSKGYGFITFHDSEDAKRALDQLNGFELAGRPMKVNHVTERNENAQAASLMDNDELERTGIELSATDRIQLMVKLAEDVEKLNKNFLRHGRTVLHQNVNNPESQYLTAFLKFKCKDFRIPSGAMEAINPLGQVPGVGVTPMAGMPGSAGVPAAPVNLQASLAAAQAQAQHQAAALAAQQVTAGTAAAMGAAPTTVAAVAAAVGAPGANTPCFMLSNMFDPATESNPSWDIEIREDVIEECNKHGGVLHIHVDKTSPQGNVYVKCPTPQIALAAVSSLHGRWFAGKMITAAYVPIANYHAIFPQAAAANALLQSATGR